jgi:hypothetical protein
MFPEALNSFISYYSSPNNNQPLNIQMRWTIEQVLGWEETPRETRLRQTRAIQYYRVQSSYIKYQVII